MHALCVRAVPTLIGRDECVPGSRSYWHKLGSRHGGISTVYLSNVGGSQTDAGARSGAVGRSLGLAGSALSTAMSIHGRPSPSRRPSTPEAREPPARMGES